MLSRSVKAEPLCVPLARRPPVVGGGDHASSRARHTCLPTLLLELPEWIVPELGDVLRNDLAYSASSTASRWLPFEDGVVMNVLNFCDGPTLVNLTRAWGGSEIVPESRLRDPDTGEIVGANLEPYRGRRYQAIVVDDTSMVHTAAVADFVAQKFHRQNASVVIVSVEGLFDLQPYRERFGVDWRFAAYTKRTIRLSDLGHRILTSDAFKPATKYVKACFIEGGRRPANAEGSSNAAGQPEPDSSRDREALFVEHVDPRDYEDESSDDEGGEGRGPPPPAPGSPVVCSIQGEKSVSYFGFVNTLAVSYGAIILRLCYAAQHNACQVEQNER